LLLPESELNRNMKLARSASTPYLASSIESCRAIHNIDNCRAVYAYEAARWEFFAPRGTAD